MWDYKAQIDEELFKVPRPGMKALIDYLHKSDYFTAPASRQNHECEAGGLSYHSWKVFRLLSHKAKIYKLPLSEDTIRITGLLHDVCYP